MRRQFLSVILLIFGSLAACDRVDDRDGVDATLTLSATLGTNDRDVLGTIQAMLDGVERTWYVVDGNVGGRPYASALWLAADGIRLITLGGFDTDEPPLETFRFDLTAGDLSFGSYTGSAIQVLLSVTAGERSARAELPNDDRQFGVAYMPVATATDMLTGALTLAEGSIDLADVIVSNETVSVRGTFSGTLRSMDETEAIEVEDGRFDVSGIPNQGMLTGN